MDELKTPRYTVRTFIDFETGLIRAETWYEAVDRHQLMATRLIQTEDKAVRDALVALGWTPPDDTWRRPSYFDEPKGTDTPAPPSGALRDTSPGKGGIPPRPFLSVATTEALREAGQKIAREVDRAIKRTGPFPNEATLFGSEKPLKVHMFFDQKGATYSACGRTTAYANTVCKHNGPVKHVTRNFRDVTCKTCRRKWKRMTSDG